MLVIDSLLLAGIRFVIEKLIDVVDAELNDDKALKERLVSAQLQLETGTLDVEEFSRIEADVLARLRDIRARRGEGVHDPGEVRITGIEATVAAELDEPPPELPPAPRRRSAAPRGPRSSPARHTPRKRRA